MGRRGGRQMPKDGPQPPGGPGAFSQRTDAQKVATPRVHDPDATRRGVGLQQGDRQMLEAAMGTVPLPGNAPPRPSGSGGGSSPNQGGPAGSEPNELPGWFAELESQRPGEPVTAGLDMGPGPGSEILEPIHEPEDDAEVVLSWLAGQGVRVADDMLREIQAARIAEVPPVAGMPPVPPSLDAPVEASAPMSGDEIQAEEIDLPEEVPEGAGADDEVAVDAGPEEVAPTPDPAMAAPAPEVTE